MTTTPCAWRPPVLALALSLAALQAATAAVFDAPDANFTGAIAVAPLPPVYPGGQATVQGRNLKPGQRVTLLRGTTDVGNGAATVAPDGTFKATVRIPADAAVGTQPLIAAIQGPDAAVVVPLKVSPQLAPVGAERFDRATRQVAQGLYQATYSEKSQALFLTSSVGVRPLKSAAIIKVDPATLQTVATGASPATDAVTGFYGVYGIDVDDAHGTVWATNTRQDTVAVYRQSDLALVKQLPPGAAPRAHEIAIDTELGRAYVSTAAERPPSPAQNQVVVFDTATQQPTGRIDITSTRAGQVFNTLGLALDSYRHKLYVTSLNTGELAVIDTQSNTVDKVIALPVASAMGVAVDPSRNLVFVASPSADGVLIVDAAMGDVLHTTATGAGALKVAYDAARGLVYVANRAAGTVTAVNENGQIVGNLELGPFPNHIATDGHGAAFVLSKMRGGPNAAEDASGDPLTRLQFKN
ncbi:MAG: putative protein YncE [Paracidovorax wautersii]|uniref:DNA-binding beta-propeller fold protein YncE n=1 Tax=Paracidovorax wautersii TaxID=1177982 RepID=A0A7V8FQI7_9BURK|nr:MAG: putative protein YncE [Paracidovorax wautersii]